ncbi:MAG: DUF262 domain-containing protein, partial [Acidimicrobiales bacterium]|nr:DUF262 domain-containing protein [Acidimicrobiales bacterium]MYB80213.1 DUF262 domain-containing protein [Acidimicrobiales bacterium]MYI12659.1 DUF262 domain-containing protein [Acidimicrobiales bacterium]
MPSIAELLFDAEKGQIHIPDFQRPWVWNKDKVRKLVASRIWCNSGWGVGSGG